MSTQQSGLVSGNKQNIAGGSTPHNRSTFPLSYSRFQTERFAEYVPFFVMEGIKNDRLPLHSNHEVQTYTLKSPILQSLAKKKDYFVVPMQCILPNNWEKFYTQPNIGQDVPSDCGLGVANFWSKMKTLFENSVTALRSILADSSETAASKMNALFHFLIFFEPIYSCGSLMSTLGISSHNWFRALDQAVASDPRLVTYDEIFDSIIGIFNTRIAAAAGNGFYFILGGRSYLVVDSPLTFDNSSVQQVSMREALELMRDDLSFSIGNWQGTIGSLITDITTYINDIYFSLPLSDAPLNLGRLWAYQLVVSHFYSNDHVDFIYSAELFRQYVMQLVTRVYSAASPNPIVPSFTVNGLEYQYDALSAKFMDLILASFGSSGIYSKNSGILYPSSLDDVYAYFVALFSFKRSLRFQDYFTGSRAYPLAGNQNPAATVSGGQVEVLEMSRASMFTKFLQAVNRSGRKFSNYMKELFGGKDLAYDFHNPMYLSHTSDLVGAQETDNTGAAQVQDKIAVTSRLRATSSARAFEFVPDRDCIVIGISYYDLPRIYTRTTEAQNFFVDRFDMFNPFLQYTGDQGISEAEIGTDTPNVSLNFSYCNKDMHYKQRYNQACGGFCVPTTQLDTWIFPADIARRRFFHNISPSFIRSFNSELDRFYQFLTGYSLGTYFHFIVRYDNRMDAGREMTYAPTINV